MRTRKMISVALSLLMLLGGMLTLFSCGENKADDQPNESQSETAVNSDSNGNDAAKEPLKLVENGKSEYVVVYPNDASATILAAVDEFIAEVEQKTGVTLKSKSDNLRGKPSHDPNEKAILVGKTNYDESQTVLDTLGRFEYKIVQEGNKVVIVSLSDLYVQTAVKYYVSHLLDDNVSGDEGAKTLLLEEYHFVPEGPYENVVTINGVDITEFSIVYPSNDVEYRKIGETLRDAVLSSMGVELPIYADSKGMSEYEILLGKTSRPLSQSLYENTKKYIATYSLEVSGTKIQILSGGYASAVRCISKMRFNVFNSGKVEYTDGSYLKTDLFENYSEMTDDADIRIMTANVLNQAWTNPGDCYDVQYRAELLAGVLAAAKPDAIGIQEAAGKWQTELEKWFEVLKDEYGVEYTWHHKSYEGKEKYTSIVYRSDKYTCVDEDVQIFSHSVAAGSSTMRIITKCRLRSNTDPTKEFIFLNTHWDGANMDPEYIRDDNTKTTVTSHESIEYVNEQKSEGCPIFFTGDFNAVRGDARLEDFITATGVQSIDEGSGWIDFTFFYGDGVTAKGNVTLQKSHHYNMTDHPIRYTDFDLWQ